MKTKYLLIEASRTVDETARVFFVWVGAGKQADRDYLRLVAHAADNGYYFERFDEPVAAFYARLRASVPNLAHPVAVSARDFCRALRDGSRPALMPWQLRNLDHLRLFLEPNYIIPRRGGVSNRPA